MAMADLFLKRFNSFSIKRYPYNHDISTYSNNISLFLNSISLQKGIQMRENILKSNDSVLIQKFNHWESIKRTLAKLYSLPIQERKTGTDALEQEANDLEKYLIRSSSAFREEQNKLQITTDNVKKALSQMRLLLSL